ncbi:hypothetical protein SASPL_102229 [Salvia splendens]|uniref:Myb proto-oncogene protein, plant n=1 Tax=Salvia splendens TaxID=180675 RepID=A0A8X8YWB3_SALSN|nr:hypothetical protein SASPL_102229 [Salvia splendens]
MEGAELRKGPWHEEEDDQLAASVAVLGDKRWDALAKASGGRRLPGRTDNEIKNYWRSYSKKKAPLVEKEYGSMRPECATKSPMKNDLCDAMRSPYEARLTEWMSNWPTDGSFDCNIYSPEWIPGNWDISLWGGE